MIRISMNFRIFYDSFLQMSRENPFDWEMIYIWSGYAWDAGDCDADALLSFYKWFLSDFFQMLKNDLAY